MKFTRLADWLRWQESLNPAEIELGLDRVRAVWARLGERPAPTVITVGGTNGKGSCAAFLDAILSAAGYRVGRYTSPHLLIYNERIRIAGVMVADDDLMTAFQRVEDARGEVPLTYFEYGTLAALDLFARASLDVAVLEVGLGGRLDAVNVVDADVALLTTVDIDHTAWLGATREAVGIEKAGIFRAGRPAVFGSPDPPDSVVLRAAELGVPLWVAGREYEYRVRGAQWEWRGAGTLRYGLPLPALRGAHQVQNAAAAIAALQRLEQALPLGQGAVRAGLLAAEVSGRFQVMPGSPRVVLDVAHNPQAARALAANLRQLMAGGRVLAVFSALADKDVEGIVAPLADLIDEWHLAPVSGARAMTGERLQVRVAQGAAGAVCTLYASIGEACRRVLAAAAADDLVVAFGSFLVVAEVIAELEAADGQAGGVS